MSSKSVRLLWTAALALLAAVLILVNRPEKPASPAEAGPVETQQEESTVPLGAEPGQRLPDFTVTCLDGSRFTLSAHRGKVVVINLWATWCTPCVRELPEFDRLLQERPEEVAVLAVHSPPVTTDVAEYLSAFSWSLPFAVDEDGSLSELLQASTVLPQTVVIGPDGLVSCNHVGSVTYETLTDLVEAALP